jgi:diguanylate cyclase (GGDEF)-like protein
MQKMALIPESPPKEPFGQRLTWAIPVSVVILLFGGWWVILSNLRTLQSSISAAFQESQLQTARVSARNIELYAHQSSFPINQLENEVYNRIVNPSKLPAGSAWLVTPRHFYIQLPGLPPISSSADLPRRLLFQGRQGAYRYDQFLSAVQNGQEGVGWCIWQTERGAEVAAWSVAYVNDETWVIGYSLPFQHILQISSAQKQFAYTLTMMILTSLGGLLLALLTVQNLERRYRAEAQIEQINRELEQRVTERTLELARINIQLSDEIERRQQAEQEQAKNLHLLERLNTITRTALQTPNLQNLLDTLAQELPQWIGADACYITLYDAEENRFRVAAAHGFEPNKRPPDAEPGEETLSGNALRTGQPIAVTDTYNSPLISARLAKSSPRALMALPLLVEGHSPGLGAILLGFHAPHAFSEADVRVGQQIAAQVSLAILKSRLLEEVQQRAERLNILYEIGLAITAQLELSAVIETIYEQCRRVLPADAFYLALYDEQTQMVQIPLFYDNHIAYKISPFSIHERQSLTTWVIQHKHTVYMRDVLDPNETLSRLIVHMGGTPSRSFISTPLLFNDQVVGVLSVQSYQPNAYRNADVNLLETIAAQAAIAIENARNYQKVEWKAIVDELTGVYNRRGLFLLGQREVERAQRTGRPLSVLFMDVDGFRDFNNHHSYEVGDGVLQTVGAQLRTSLRSMDIVGRYGGDEFVVLLPETDLATAYRVGERLRQNVAEIEVLVNGQTLHITLSIGVSLLQENTSSLKDILRQAASLLRRAKDQGRNRVISF